MREIFRAAAVLAGFIVCGERAAAQSDPRCSVYALPVDGGTVAARFCVPGEPPSASVAISESFAARGRSFTKLLALATVPGQRTTRAIDDVDLAPLAIARTLHLTLAYRAGRVTLEHALALPGAIPVK